MKLTLMQCHPDVQRLATWATRLGLAAADDDLGYVLHALLAAAFGEDAPKPFRHFADARGLLAYSNRNEDRLQLASLSAAPDVFLALGLDRFATRPFPAEWTSGQRLGFELRARPILRSKDGRERDVYLAAVDKNGNETPIREAVYAEWLKMQIAKDGAATLEDCGVNEFKLSASVRKGGKPSEGKRPSRRVTGPDVVFDGTLTVGDPAAFAAQLERGIGRHRAFGFGMLLLRPPALC